MTPERWQGLDTKTTDAIVRLPLDGNGWRSRHRPVPAHSGMPRPGVQAANAGFETRQGEAPRDAVIAAPPLLDLGHVSLCCQPGMCSAADNRKLDHNWLRHSRVYFSYRTKKSVSSSPVVSLNTEALLFLFPILSFCLLGCKIAAAAPGIKSIFQAGRKRKQGTRKEEHACCVQVSSFSF